MTPLTFADFLSGCEMVQNHLRIPPAQYWSADVCKLKFSSFQTSFPEASATHFWWACETWIQGVGQAFSRFPTWAELMSPLYKCQGDCPVRAWGFRDDLPTHLRPQPWQLKLLPAPSLALPADSRPFVPAPPREGRAGSTTLESAAAAAQLVIRRRLETGLLRGRWSREEFGGDVDPSDEFLQAHPEFNDRQFRDMARWEADARLSGEGLSSATGAAMRAAARCEEGP